MKSTLNTTLNTGSNTCAEVLKKGKQDLYKNQQTKNNPLNKKTPSKQKTKLHKLRKWNLNKINKIKDISILQI